MKNVLKIMEMVISIFFAILFSYAAMSKSLDFKNFAEKLAQSLGLQGSGETVAYLIIALTTMTVLMLCYRTFRFWGLLLAFGMLTVVTAYNGFILMDSKNLPCTCIGLVEKMTWKDNLVLNAGLMITSLIGILMLRIQKSIDQNNKMERDASLPD
ncbi:MAG: hypothetical protein LC127_02145 [Chitinophagales bacterium]|nr:hypothetical protein [Chitinophagales bacterium]